MSLDTFKYPELIFKKPTIMPLKMEAPNVKIVHQFNGEGLTDYQQTVKNINGFLEAYKFISVSKREPVGERYGWWNLEIDAALSDFSHVDQVEKAPAIDQPLVSHAADDGSKLFSDLGVTESNLDSIIELAGESIKQLSTALKNATKDKTSAATTADQHNLWVQFEVASKMFSKDFKNNFSSFLSSLNKQIESLGKGSRKDALQTKMEVFEALQKTINDASRKNDVEAKKKLNKEKNIERLGAVAVQGIAAGNDNRNKFYTYVDEKNSKQQDEIAAQRQAAKRTGRRKQIIHDAKLRLNKQSQELKKGKRRT